MLDRPAPMLMRHGSGIPAGPAVRQEAGGQRALRDLSLVVGVSGARRNTAAAVAHAGQLQAFCEQERLTRIRGTGMQSGVLPSDAVNAVLARVGMTSERVAAYVTAEDALALPPRLPRVRLEHHHAHAATAFLTSPFDDAAVLVCDQNSSPEVSVWKGRGTELVNQHWPWTGEGFASLYTQAAEAYGFGPGQEHRVEALARLNRGTEAEKLLSFFEYADGSLHVDPDWRKYLITWTAEGGSRSTDHACLTASALQHALADALLKLVSDIRRSTGAARLCLGGGLFYNTFFNTVVAQSGLFEDVFVAPNPGNAGLAAGAALAVSGRGAVGAHREMVSPFLGPEYTLEEIKADLDNCKLSYDCVPYGELTGLCVEALLAGRLVGWFQGRMEWGHRALGNRSILASPLSPYVLDNLNVFLKRRERYRAYSLSVPAGDAERYFEGPPHSEWMEFDYRVKDRDLFRHVIPPGAATLRVQTVNGLAPLFAELHRAFEAASGTSVLVNTSFNGFSEPIVCSPRDAIRVFYGTGLDMLVLGRFVIRK